MNLHGIAAPIIAAVNPMTQVTVNISTGYTINPDSSRTPTYTTITASAQIQALTWQDLEMMDGLVLNGERRSIYLYGKFDSVDRGAGTGGDIIIFPDTTQWLIAFVFEVWPDWCRVAATRQIT